MCLEVFQNQEIFDLRFKTLNGKKKHHSGCQQLYTIMQAVSDVFKN